MASNFDSPPIGNTSTTARCEKLISGSVVASPWKLSRLMTLAFLSSTFLSRYARISASVPFGFGLTLLLTCTFSFFAKPGFSKLHAGISLASLNRLSFNNSENESVTENRIFLPSGDHCGLLTLYLDCVSW